jgi:hypothetical protein
LTEVEQNGELIQPKPNLHQPSLSVYIATFKEVWSQLLDVWLVFFVTLALFPKVLLDINPGNTYDILNYGDKISSLCSKIYQVIEIF